MEDFWVQPPPLSAVPLHSQTPQGAARAATSLSRPSLCGDKQTASALASVFLGGKELISWFNLELP